MGMLLHSTLMEMEKARSIKRETKVEKPVENPVETESEVKPTRGRRKVSK